MSKSVIVLGGTGLLGYHTTLELVARGYEVTSVALPPMPAIELFPAGVTSMLADLNAMTDMEVAAAFRGQYAVFYAVGADERVTPRAPAARFFYEANVMPTQRIARIAREAGVQKFIVYGSYTAEFAEIWPDLGYRDRNGYPRMRLLQEEVACLEGAGAMDVMILRLPYIFGTMPGRLPLWNTFVDVVRSQPETIAVAGGSTSSVTVRQVAKAAVGAMLHGRHEGRYPINEYDLTYAEFNRMICDALGRDRSAVVIARYDDMLPAHEALDAEAAVSGVEHGIHMVDALTFQYRDATSDPTPTKKALHYGDDDVPAAIRDTLEYCLAQSPASR